MTENGQTHFKNLAPFGTLYIKGLNLAQQSTQVFLRFLCKTESKDREKNEDSTFFMEKSNQLLC